MILYQYLHYQIAVNMVESLTYDKVFFKPLAKTDDFGNRAFAGALWPDEYIDLCEIYFNIFQRPDVFYN